MKKRVITQEDLDNMDIRHLFTSLIAVWGMEGASQVVQHYYDSIESRGLEYDEEEESECMDAIIEGVEALTELFIRKLKE